MDRIRPDFSTPLGIQGSETEYLLDPRYDFIRLFPWLEMGIINVLTEKGVARLYVDEATCRKVEEAAQIPLVELDWITESENESMRQIQMKNLDDSWLE